MKVLILSCNTGGGHNAAARAVAEAVRAHGDFAEILDYLCLAGNGVSRLVGDGYVEVYSGVFFKEFVLFFGENLQYYIMEESENEEQLTESGSLQKSDIMNESPDSKYEIINDMMISMTLQDDTTLDHLIEEYYRREYLDHRLFTLQ